ncbi:MAG TPA: glycosyltransferase family 39 protein [Dongiaceae bacterium]|jgi:hypothetical protein|nr:glycosyltransferase family 39 protein [Dongiaceae bacterium]
MFLQEIIYKLEVGGEKRYVRLGMVALVVIFLLLLQNWLSFRNFSNSEAMDAAQVGRNLAEGKGFSTELIRPFSIYLLQQKADPNDADPARLRSPHPDLANAPVYPLMLAGLMKTLPFKYPVNTNAPFLSQEHRFKRYQPDLLIAFFNEFLFFVLIAQTFFLARRLFDPGIAWVSALLLAGSNLLWQFAFSGLSTLLLINIFMGLCWALVALEKAAREGTASPGRVARLALAVGAIVGVGALTRYSFGWLIVPALLFVLYVGAQRRVILTIATLAAFLAVLSPWVARNVHLSGMPFGLASFAPIEATSLFPEHQLERSLTPVFQQIGPRLLLGKLTNNAREILQNEVPLIGGTWLAPLFLVGLLVAFQNPTLNRLRYFILLSLGLLILVQALGRTQISADAPLINTENLLVLLYPVILIFGVWLFFLLLDQVTFAHTYLRFGVIGVFGIVVCLQLLMLPITTHVNPVAYPPYYPPIIQKTCSWMRPDELMMSDVPAAVAWYGDRQCLELTLNAKSEFFAINDAPRLKPIQALYLTPQTIDFKLLQDWVRGGDNNWGSFILEVFVKKEIPNGFPLNHMPSGLLPEQMFFSDWQRWNVSSVDLKK